MRYKNYILSKGDKVKLKATGDHWFKHMTENYGGKVVTICDFIHDFGFVSEPLRDDIMGYCFMLDDIDEVVYCKNDHTEPSVTPKKKVNNAKYNEEYCKLKQLKDVLYEEREHLKHLITCTEPSHDEFTATQIAYMRSEICMLKSLIDLIAFRMNNLKEAIDD